MLDYIVAFLATVCFEILQGAIEGIIREGNHLIEIHGGTIEVFIRGEGEGSTFRDWGLGMGMGNW